MPEVIDLKKAVQAKHEASTPSASESSRHRLNKLNGNLSWSGPLSYHHPNPRAVLVVTLALFAIATLVQIFQHSIITTIFFAMLGAMVLLHAKKKPRQGHFTIDPLGLKINGRRYNFREIKSFWIDYRPEFEIRELVIQLKKWYSAYIKIPFDEQNPIQIRQLLIDYIPEVEHEETLADTLSRRLGI